ncbi:MAG: aldehyde dehydrogenase family protein [Bacteroidales bacterium]|nr:aldehyde dehydrogenase family protein [Bacteroidales bacterium]
MKNTPFEDIDRILSAQKRYFDSGATLSIDFRKEMLKRLQKALKEWEKPLCDALWQDLHKSYEEAYLTELSIVSAEVRSHLKNIRRWARRERKCTPLKLFPSRSYIVKEPLGNTLVVSPWNYPVQLLLNPLVGAISSGCTAILKPSPYVPHVSETIGRMISGTFPPEYVAVVQGNREVNSYLFEQKFDLIFFTGSPDLGRKVMAAASRNLTPVILELGGKSPCIIDRSANIKTTAKRIAWGKTLNAGQTCIAPDYLIMHEDIKDKFVCEYAKAVTELHGKDIKSDTHYVRMVSDKAFDRVSSYLNEGEVIYGGELDKSSRYIAPAMIDRAPMDSPVMNEEIFGPVFPIVTFGGDEKEFSDKVSEFINGREKPLAFYYFGKEKTGWELIRRTSSGGGCINDCIMHIANENIPFGGVGNSGLGRYHKRESFEAFTHRRSIVTTCTLVDLPFRYMPYRMFSLVKKIL